METKLVVFSGKKIRRMLHNNEWWFSVIDVIEAITDSDRPRKYWSDLKSKLISEGFIEVSEKIGQLKMPAPDGKMRETMFPAHAGMNRSASVYLPSCFNVPRTCGDEPLHGV